MFQTKAKLIKNIEVAPDYYRMVLDAPSIAKAAKPGQFVNILVSEKYEPLLRRPFSIHKVNNSKIEILYKLVGKGTELLSQKRPGTKLDILGPLGNGFDLKVKKRKDRATLVGGGIGIAPLVFLAEKLALSNILVLIGAKNKRHILCTDELKNLGCEVRISTDDGSSGFKGCISQLLKKILSTIDCRPRQRRGSPKVASTIYACGPKPMLKEIAKISQRYKIPTQVSLEEHMACGIGACFGCVVNTKHGYKRVCKEGPVFDIKEVVF